MRFHQRGCDAVLFDLLDDSGENVNRTAVLLRELFTEYPEGNGVGGKIVECEHRGDRIAHDILTHVATQRPRLRRLDPADVHALTCALDDVVDYAEEAADQLRRYDVEASMEAAQRMAEILVAAAQEVSGGLRGLRDGYDATAHLIEIHRLENQADETVRAAVAALFARGIDPMVVIRWKDIFESLEAAVDACETAANVLEGIALKDGRRR